MRDENGYEEYDPDLGRYVWICDGTEDETVDEDLEEVEA